MIIVARGVLACGFGRRPAVLRSPRHRDGAGTRSRDGCATGAPLVLRCTREMRTGFICVTSEGGGLYFVALDRPYRLAVRTPPFHGGSTGSIPVRVAIQPGFMLLPGPLAPAPVTPRIDNQEDENQETKDCQEDCTRFGLPQLLEASGNFLKIHAGNLHQHCPERNRL